MPRPSRPQQITPRPAGVPQPPTEHILVTQQTRFSAQYQGPLPPPEMLAAYDEVKPGTADRLITLLELQTNHRIDIEKTVIYGSVRRADRGLVWGGVVALTGMLASAGLGFSGHEASAVALGIADLVSLVGVFVLGNNRQKQDINEKAKQPPPSAPQK